MSLLTCVYHLRGNLERFRNLKVFVTDWLTHSLSLTRPGGAFAPKKQTYQIILSYSLNSKVNLDIGLKSWTNFSNFQYRSVSNLNTINPCHVITYWLALQVSGHTGPLMLSTTRQHLPDTALQKNGPRQELCSSILPPTPAAPAIPGVQTYIIKYLDIFSRIIL